MTYKRTLKGSGVSWCFKFDAPGSTKQKRIRIQEYGYATKKEATDAEAARRILEAEKAKAPKLAQITLRQLLTDCQADRNLEATTVETYKQMAGYLSDEVLEMEAKDVTAWHLHREWERLSERLAPNTIRVTRSVVSAAFGRGLRWGIVTINPADASAPPKAAKGKGMALLPAQVRTLIDAAPTTWLSRFISLADATGCRRGELLALEWSNLDGNSLTIARSLAEVGGKPVFKGTKNGKTRVLTLPAAAVQMLQEHRAEQEAARQYCGAEHQSDLIFCRPDGSPRVPNYVSSKFKLLVRKLKLPAGVSLHTLRHTHGSQLLAAGVPITDVSKRLGHTNVAITAAIYSHALVGSDDRATQKWEAFQQASDGKVVRQ